MKKIFTMIAAISFAATASAQVIANYDFENGQTKGCSSWENKGATIVEGDKVKSGKKALMIKSGSSFAVHTKEDKSEVKVSLDAFNQWGKTDCFLRIFYYDKAKDKLTGFDPVLIPKVKGYSHFEHTFKAKKAGMYRVQFFSKSGHFAVDNVKVEIVK